MKIKNFIIFPTLLLITINCGSEGWTAEQEQELLKDCPKKNSEQCKCGAEIMKNEFTYEEYIELRSMDAPDEALIKRARDIDNMINSNCGE